MEDNPRKPDKQTARYRALAVVFIVCGMLAVAFTVFNTYDSASRPYATVSSIDSVSPDLLRSVQPKPEEWPLFVARTNYYAQDTRSNRYTVEITPLRGTILLRLDVIGRSPERTTAFGLWLTEAFARDFSGSLVSRNISSPKVGPKSLIAQVPGSAAPLRLHPGTLLFSLFTPLLLLASGILLFRVSKAGTPDT